MKIKSFIIRKPWIAVVSVILLTVMACGAIASFTDNDMKIFQKPLNEDNLLYDTYRALDEKKDSSGITYKNRDGVITINGEIPDTESANDSVLVFATKTLKAGTYTYTCFDKANENKYFSYIKYGTNVVFADFENTNATISGMTVAGNKTFTLTEDTEVEFVICVKKGTKCINVNAYPVLVAGETAGDFYDEGK